MKKLFLTYLYTFSFFIFGQSDLLAGVWNDQETGFHHMRCRYYHPELRGFITRDPLSTMKMEIHPSWTEIVRDMNSDSLGNLYAFVENNPGTFIDPWGLATVRIEYTDKDNRSHVIVLVDKSLNMFRDALNEVRKNNGIINSLSIIGHATSNYMTVDKGASGSGLVKVNDDIYFSDTGKSFSEELKDLISAASKINLKGCNTANDREMFNGDKNNITKILSKNLKDVTVTGFRGLAFGNELSIPFFRDQSMLLGKRHYAIGIPRSYRNGQEQ